MSLPRGLRRPLGAGLKALGLALLWLLESLVLRALASQPIGNAMVRTTTASTMFSGGIKDNVLPSEARATVNFRILPGDTIDRVLGHVKEVIDDERIIVTKLQRLVSNPPPEAPTDSHAYRLLEGAIHRYFPSALVTPTLVVGGTDAREYARLARGVYHFVPFVLHPDDRLRVHGTDERIPIDALATMVATYRHLLRDIE
jgi:carboxypeptidase PM20D1